MVVAAMEEVQQRAGEQEGVRDQAEQMLPVFRIEQVKLRSARPKPRPAARRVCWTRFIAQSS
jgi:hypothetical protein